MNKPMKKKTNKEKTKKKKGILGRLKKKVTKLTSKKKPKQKVKKPTKKVKKKTVKQKAKPTKKKITSKKITKKKKITKTKVAEKIIEQKPISKMSPEERKTLAQKKLPKRRKPSKKKEQKIKKSRRQILKDPVIRQQLINLAGEHALAMVQEFTYEMSDDDLSRKIKVKVSEIRSTLNKLHSRGIVTYSRSKDSETGWYSYIWKFHQNKVAVLLEDVIKMENENEESQTELYYCSQCDSEEEIPFEDAVDIKFRCPLCSMPLSYKERIKK